MKNVALEIPLIDKPRKYKYKAQQIFDESPLILLPNISPLRPFQSISISFTSKAKYFYIYIIYYLDDYSNYNRVYQGDRKIYQLSSSPRNGFNVVICSRNQKQVEQTVNEINLLANNKGLAIGYKCDTSKSSEVEYLVKLAIDKFRKIDVLINNAGIAFYKNMIDTAFDEWSNTININLNGCFLFCKYVLPTMIKNNVG